mmetsp:Transcript_24227/g.49621  ORF Transcript_24227/g.49621 Transcript_24227/m.49621 type:complete len:241 (-) Transcript_24227:125-847(-)
MPRRRPDATSGDRRRVAVPVGERETAVHAGVGGKREGKGPKWKDVVVVVAMILLLLPPPLPPPLPLPTVDATIATPRTFASKRETPVEETVPTKKKANGKNARKSTAPVTIMTTILITMTMMIMIEMRKITSTANHNRHGNDPNSSSSTIPTSTEGTAINGTIPTPTSPSIPNTSCPIEGIAANGTIPTTSMPQTTAARAIAMIIAPERRRAVEETATDGTIPTKRHPISKRCAISSMAF